MNTDALRKSTAVVSALSMLPHIFCCGIPAVMALISLGTTVGLAGVLATNPFYQFVDAYHTVLITLAVTTVVISGVLNLIAYRIDCHTASSHCHHGDCTPKKKTGFKLFFLSCGLLCLDLAWFATEKFGLGLHAS